MYMQNAQMYDSALDVTTQNEWPSILALDILYLKVTQACLCIILNSTAIKADTPSSKYTHSLSTLKNTHASPSSSPNNGLCGVNKSLWGLN